MASKIIDQQALQGILQPMLGLAAYLRRSSISEHLIQLLSMRVSQINGCAFRLEMHARDLRQAGEREDRIAVLAAWRETTWFTDRERAALAWAEEMTFLPNREASEAVFEQTSALFSEQELAELSLAVIAINDFNRLNIAFHHPPQPFFIEAGAAVDAVD